MRVDSNILFLDLPRRPTVIVNSFDDAVELMERRSKLYSDRPQDFMDTLTGWTWNMGFHPYGQRWRDTRRNFHQHFHQLAVSEYHPIQTREIRLLLKRALTFSETVDVKSISLTFTSIILEAAYGIGINSLDDELASLSQKATQAINVSKNIGEYWIEFYPWLRYVPVWGPGARAKKVAGYYKPFVNSTRNVPFEAVSKAVDEGTATPSILQQLLQKLRDERTLMPADTPKFVAQIQAAKDAAGVAYAGKYSSRFRIS
ncbi:hypothetical protein EIP86_009260 [Pleurotus ostreatoroseus]|nr:hypothetical protein EIP86_009260 [Pleurotus ostreatoroseus]